MLLAKYIAARRECRELPVLAQQAIFYAPLAEKAAEQKLPAFVAVILPQREPSRVPEYAARFYNWRRFRRGAQKPRQKSIDRRSIRKMLPL